MSTEAAVTSAKMANDVIIHTKIADGQIRSEPPWFCHVGRRDAELRSWAPPLGELGRDPRQHGAGEDDAAVGGGQG